MKKHTCQIKKITRRITEDMSICDSCKTEIKQESVSPLGASLKCRCSYWEAPYYHMSGNAMIKKMRYVGPIKVMEK